MATALVATAMASRALPSRDRSSAMCSVRVIRPSSTVLDRPRTSRPGQAPQRPRRGLLGAHLLRRASPEPPRRGQRLPAWRRCDCRRRCPLIWVDARRPDPCRCGRPRWPRTPAAASGAGCRACANRRESRCQSGSSADPRPRAVSIGCSRGTPVIHGSPLVVAIPVAVVAVAVVPVTVVAIGAVTALRVRVAWVLVPVAALVPVCVPPHGDHRPRGGRPSRPSGCAATAPPPGPRPEACGNRTAARRRE